MDLHELTRLGQATEYPDDYAPELLQPIPRSLGRDSLGLDEAGGLPFSGVDLWTHYEVSWCDRGGKPAVAIAEIRVPADSPSLIESKSLKLYFNSLNFMRFDQPADFLAVVERDLAAAAGTAVSVTLRSAAEPDQMSLWPGRCVDDLPLQTDTYEPDPGLLKVVSDEIVDEVLHSHLLRSNCPVTDQPDWGSVLIHYRGPRLDPAGVLAYIVSFRRHSDFHEQCVERMFVDLQQAGALQLSVYARYTRRGGLDINPFRSNFEVLQASWRTARQ